MQAYSVEVIRQCDLSNIPAISLSLSVIQTAPLLFRRHETQKDTDLSSSRKLGGEFIKKKTCQAVFGVPASGVESVAGVA